MMKNLLLLLLIFPFVSFAQNGARDKSFGEDGIALNKTLYGTLKKLAFQSDGKIIGAGSGSLNNNFPFLMCRYNPDGVIDSSFGTNGVAGHQDLSATFGLAVSADNSIITLGHTSSDIKLIKYKQNGNIDSSFGSNGTVITNVGANDIPVDVLLQPDGKIIAGGYIINQPNQARQGFLIRYLQDGNLDNSFGNNGIVVLGDVNGDKSFGGVFALALQSNGQILLSAVFNGGVVYRFNVDGSIDNKFGIKGMASFQQSDGIVKSFTAYSLNVQSDGKIVGGGISLKKQFSSEFTYMAAARLNADGSIDSSFGSNGLSHIEFQQNPSEATKILVQDDDGIIISGRTFDENQTFSHLALAKLNSSGNLDSTFGENGQVVTDVEGSAGSSDALLQKDQKVLLGGDTYVAGGIGGNSYFLLARYDNDQITKRQILITKIKKWIQHHNGITWDGNANAKSYAIQRSYDGIHFSPISRINRNNNSTYTYADPAPFSSTNYYRLQTTSVDGAVNYSNVLAITNTDIKISPNPAKNTLHIEGLLNQKVKVSVVDFSGNIKLQTDVTSTSYNLNIASLKPGNYLLKVESKEDVVTKAFIKE